jgi:hypothetical protein
MTDTPTPGQVAYEAFICVDGLPHWRTWNELRRVEKARWDAAAQAVLAMQAPVPTMTPAHAIEELRRLVGQYYAGVDVDASMARVRGEAP